MSENPYERMAPPGPFGKAVDAAIKEANERYLSDPEQQEADRENGKRWAALMAAQKVAQGYGVVFPIATVEEIVKELRGEPSKFSEAFSEGMLERMVETALERARNPEGGA